MKYIQVQFPEQTAEQNEILVAMLAGFGFEGFEENENVLKAFIGEPAFDKEALDAFAVSNNLSYSLSVIEEQNWNTVWESSFEPIRVNDFVSIRAAFHQPVKDVQHEIIITPKMSFGTGHHATTYLMIEQMASLNFAGKRVLDFGTGTAVLAILAEKMGAASVNAIDNDDWSIENSKENIAANNCTKISLHKADAIVASGVYDIILANINLNVITASLPSIAAAAGKGTYILLSGFFKADEGFLSGELAKINAAHLGTSQKGEWVCMLNQLS